LINKLSICPPQIEYSIPLWFVHSVGEIIENR